MTFTVTAADALGDQAWFGANPPRRYRVRPADDGWWLVRRRSGGVLLRTWTATLPPGLPDTDKAMRDAWFAAAWPDLGPIERADLVKQARKMEALREL